MSRLNSTVKCPQCGYYCLRSDNPLTNEHNINCGICGYQEINTVKGIEKFKGYSTLSVNDGVVSFHEPIPFEKQKEILNSISENPNAQFIKWTDEFGLTVLKGELPEITEDEDQLKSLMSEEEYYKSFRGEVNNDCISFNKIK